MYHKYVLYDERNLGNFLSGFDNKNKRVLINRRKSLIFTPRNIGNTEKYKILCQQKRYSIFFDKEVLPMHLGTLSVC